MEYEGTAGDVPEGPGRRKVTVTVRASALLGLLELPNKLNPREPSLSTDAAKDMLAQIKSDPAAFSSKNIGIFIAVDSVRVTPNTIYAEAQSSFNGGHTRLVIKKAAEDGLDLSKVRVTIIFYQGYTDEELRGISRGVNTQTSVKPISFANQDGVFAKMLDNLPMEYRVRVSCMENDPLAPKAKQSGIDLGRMLLMLSPVAFPPDRSNQPSTLYNRKADVVEKLNDKNCNCVYPLLEDIVSLNQRVVRFFNDFNGRNKTHPITGKTLTAEQKIPLTDYDKNKNKNKNGKYNSSIARPMITIGGEEMDITPPTSLVYMAMATFRIFVDRGKWVDECGADTTLPELWDKYGEVACRAAWKAFKEGGKGLKFDVFGKESLFWEKVLGQVRLAAARNAV